MPGIASLRHRWIEIAWGAFAVANLVAMWLWPYWETVPFHFIWVSLTLLYGFRIWPLSATAALLLAVVVATGIEIPTDAYAGTQTWGELFEVPLMSAMFVAMVWHARRRQEALLVTEQLAEERASLLERQERFLHDASHELRTPVTIARGHLDVLSRLDGSSPEIEVALDELGRIERIVDRLLLLAKADRADFLALAAIDLEPFLEDVFLRWSEVAPRVWRLGAVADETVVADPEALREALDALLENAVKYTEPSEPIELRARTTAGGVAIEVADGGRGIPAEALDRVFDRFARADDGRTRAQGGTGLGLAIVDAIACAHGGSCTLQSSGNGTVVSFLLPRLGRDQRPAAAEREVEAVSSALPAWQGRVEHGRSTGVHVLRQTPN
jgi:signal transduction histidine kinase